MQVLAVFEQIHVGHILHILVFGESLLNGVYMYVCMYMCVCTYVCLYLCVGMYVLIPLILISTNC